MSNYQTPGIGKNSETHPNASNSEQMTSDAPGRVLGSPWLPEVGNVRRKPARHGTVATMWAKSFQTVRLPDHWTFTTESYSERPERRKVRDEVGGGDAAESTHQTKWVPSTQNRAPARIRNSHANFQRFSPTKFPAPPSVGISGIREQETGHPAHSQSAQTGDYPI